MCEGICITHAPSGQPIEVGRHRVPVAVATQIGTHVFAGDPDNIGPGGRRVARLGRLNLLRQQLVDGADDEVLDLGGKRGWLVVGGHRPGDLVAAFADHPPRGNITGHVVRVGRHPEIVTQLSLQP